jgi:hypothetical protein
MHKDSHDLLYRLLILFSQRLAHNLMRENNSNTSKLSVRIVRARLRFLHGTESHGPNTAEVKGKRVAIPNRLTKSKRKRLEKKRWFRNAQKCRTGCEGRISLLKRRHGLNRCRYKGLPGIQRRVGLGVIADNLINIGHALAPSLER